MNLQIIISFLTFILICGITPGPANLTSLAASLQFGKKAALRQWLGLISGALTDCIISVVIAFFLGTALNQYVKWLAFIGAAYLIYLSIKQFRRSYTTDQKEIKEPGFLTGYILNLSNVKIILTCVTALSSYVLPYSTNFFMILIFGICVGVVLPSCNLVWLFLGLTLQRFFVKHQKIINIIMGLALIYCAVKLALVPILN